MDTRVCNENEIITNSIFVVYPKLSRIFIRATGNLAGVIQLNFYYLLETYEFYNETETIL